MALDVALLRSSFDLVAEKEPEITARFYEQLFSMYPQAQALFEHVDMDKQGRMLLEALAAVVEHLDDAPWLEEHLGELGARHAGYGVEPQMYEWVGAALLRSLGLAAGADWNPRLQAAWAEAYTAVAGMMLQGASQPA